MVVLAIMGILSVVLATYLTNSARIQNYNTFRGAVENFNQSITTLLSNPQACVNTLSMSGGGPAPVLPVLDGNTDLNLTSIYNDEAPPTNPTPKYTINPNKAQNLPIYENTLVLTRIEATGVNGPGANVTLELRISYAPVKMVMGVATVKRTIIINAKRDLANGNVLSTCSASPDGNGCWTYDNNRLTISQKCNGSVGIGWANPVNQLDVGGSLAIKDYAGTNAGNASLIVGGGNVGFGTPNPAHSLDVIGDAYVSKTFGVGVAPLNTLDAVGPIALGTFAGKAIGKDAALAVGGNVGIGTITPANPLDVNGGAALGTFAGTDAKGALIVGGKVGINNSTPNQALDVVGAITVNSLVDGQGKLISAGRIGILVASPVNTLDVRGGAAFGSYAGDPKNAAPVNGLAVSGQVGIGMSAPVNQLDVSGNASVTNGNLGVGTINPKQLLHVFSQGAKSTIDLQNNQGEFLIVADNTKNDNFNYLNFTIPNLPNPILQLSSSGGIYVNGSVFAPAYFYSSDERLKSDVHSIENPIEKILSLRGVNFKWKDSGRETLGLIAQEVENVIPEVVNTSDKADHLKSVSYGNIVALLIEGFKSLWNKFSALIDRVIELETQNQKLTKRLEVLEHQIESCRDYNEPNAANLKKSSK